MKLLYLLPILLVVGCVSDSSSLTGFVAAVFEDPQPVQVSIGINNGDTIKVDMITVLQGTTALEAFGQIADIQTRDVNYATYVTAIDGLAENPRQNIFWVFYVDNQFSTYGAADYTISGPVTLEFRYEPMPEHK